jgi:cysteine desulfuration protein SufE
MGDQPGRLQDVLDMIAMFPETDARAQLLLGFADKFQEVPASVAARPFPKSQQVPQCESEAYVWAERQAQGTLKLYFAVENPSGVSAKALATILDQSLSGLPPEEIVKVSPEIVEAIFRENLSMGKGLGLRSMVLAVQALARQAMLPVTGRRPQSPDRHSREGR